MKTMELKLFNKEEAKKLSKKEIISTVFIDAIAKAILDEQKIEQKRSGENNGK